MHGKVFYCTAVAEKKDYVIMCLNVTPSLHYTMHYVFHNTICIRYRENGVFWGPRGWYIFF